MATEPLVRWDLAGTTRDEGTETKETRAFPASSLSFSSLLHRPLSASIAFRLDRVAVKDSSRGLQSTDEDRDGCPVA